MKDLSFFQNELLRQPRPFNADNSGHTGKEFVTIRPRGLSAFVSLVGLMLGTPAEFPKKIFFRLQATNLESQSYRANLWLRQ